MERRERNETPHHHKHAWLPAVDASPPTKAHRWFFFFNGKELKHEQIKRIVDYAVEKGYRTDADIPGDEVLRLLEDKKMKVNYQWHKAPKELPDCDCVCVTYYNGGYHVNVWNNYYKVWDDEEGDYAQFEASEELDWMVLEVEKEA